MVPRPLGKEGKSGLPKQVPGLMEYRYGLWGHIDLDSDTRLIPLCGLNLQPQSVK